MYWQAGRKSDAQRVLLDALKWRIAPDLSVILSSKAKRWRKTAPAYSTQYAAGAGTASRTGILREINQHHRHKFAHFDENSLNVC